MKSKKKLISILCLTFVICISVISSMFVFHKIGSKNISEFYNVVVQKRRYEGEGWNDGAVYFAWLDGETFRYVKITDVEPSSNDNVVNYKAMSTIKDSNNVQFTMDKAYRTVTAPNGDKIQDNNYAFVSVTDMEALLADDTFTAKTGQEKMEYLSDEHCSVNGRCDINPIRAKNGKNSIATMGDLGFNLVIYDEDYEAVKIDVSGTPTYYPDFWDVNFNWKWNDISETTKDSPVYLYAFLLQDTVELEANTISKTITSVKALDVSERAVSVTKVDNKFKITFSSNYYDNIEFELTDNANNKYYIRIGRINLDLKTFFDDETQQLYVATYYPSTDDYSDYVLVANIEYKDGTKELRTIKEPANKVEATNGDQVEAKYASAGTGLKTSFYQLDGIKRTQNSNVSKIYLTFTKKFDAKSTVFDGVLAGSGSGVEFADNGRGLRRVIGD